MPSIPSCIDFWQLFATGIFAVPLIEFLKKLPKVGEFFDRMGWVLAYLIPALAATVAQAVTPYCDKINVWAWVAFYAALMFAIEQLVYRVGKLTKRIS